MSDREIVRIHQGWQHKTAPLDPVSAPTNARLIGLAFQCIELLTALEPNTPPLSKQDAVRRAIGTGSQSLHLVDSEVIRHPPRVSKRSDRKVL
jgi:hypothetical protein